jgi:polysaccharide biosynthesis/export protein
MRPKSQDKDGFVTRLALSVCFWLLLNPAWAVGNSNKQAGVKDPKNLSTPAQEVDTPTNATSSTLRKPSKDDYVIGTEDVLAINVWKEPEISRSVPVRPDGKISLPLVGEVLASGLTTDQLRDNIAGKLKEYVSNPEVIVIVEGVKSRSFNIVGKVMKPGSYDLARPITVLDAIAVAGGFQEFAKTGKVYVLRREADRSREMLPFNYKLVIKGKGLDQNVELQPGDTVVVP